MAKLENQTIDSSVQLYDMVYKSGGVWYTASEVNIPQGIYEGNRTVITPLSKTSKFSLTIDTIFLGEEVGEFTGTIIINSDSDESQNIINTYGETLELSIKTLLGTKLDEDYEEYTTEEDLTGQYIDFDINMQRNPNTGDIPRKFDADSVMQSVRNILLNKRLWYGDDLDIYGLLFQNLDAPFREKNIEDTIKEKILSSEPRIGVLEVKLEFNPTNNKHITINISFTLRSNKNKFYTYPIFIRIR